MNKAHFQNICHHIHTMLLGTQNEVKIAVAWYTSKFLYGTVENLVQNKKKVSIIISDSPHNYGPLDFQSLVRQGAEVRVYPTIAGRFMHNKFCIIDDQRGITGSYNWSNNAEENAENIIEFDGDVTKQFVWLFEKLYEKSVPFDKNGPKKDEILTEEAKEDYRLFELQQRFEKKVESSIKEGASLGITIDFDNLYHKIERYGAIGAASMLVSSGEGLNLQAGFLKLAKKNRLDLSFEEMVLLPEFRQLFSPEVIQFAERKLELGKIEAQLPSVGKYGNRFR
jgi:hypothetical protein